MSDQKEAASALATFLERLGRFFDIFDLSFFVSGATAASACAVMAHSLGIQPPGLPTWLQVLAVVLTCYVAGLLCFAAGRWLRIGLRHADAASSFDAHFAAVLAGHGLGQFLEVKAYLDREEARGIWRLYIRLWAELRRLPELSESLAVINRYWVMAATFDGMTVALLAWIPAIAVLAVNRSSPGGYYLFAIAVAVIVLLARVCAREAGRYVDYQIEEVVAAIADVLARRNDGCRK